MFMGMSALPTASALLISLLLCGQAAPEPPAREKAAATAPVARTELVAPTDLIFAQRGTLPIIISAPHGGIARIEGSKDRDKGVTVLDANTAQLATLVALRITEKLGRKPFVVIAQFSRKDVDANRPREAAKDDEPFNNDAAAAQYDAYHAALRASVDACREQWKTHAVLIDIHGQARVPESIVRGTRNGASMINLTARFGQTAIVGPRSIFGQLASKGYSVLPELDNPDDASDDRKELFFNGGYITERYGSMYDDGINAIQLEFGKMRTESLERTARDTGDAIVEFYRAFLSDESTAAPISGRGASDPSPRP